MTRVIHAYTTALTLFFSASVNGQYCTSIGPSSTIDSNVESAYIAGESGTFVSYTGCPGLTGLEDLTATESVSLTASNSYSLDVQFGTCGNNYSGAGEAWIDFNGNQTFEASESIGSWSGIPPTSLSTFNFTVPSNSFNGSVRMRIIQWEAGSLPLDPCGTFTWGSAVDFEVVLSGGSGTGNYCTSVGPSSTADSNLQGLVLNGDGGTSITYTGCPGEIGLDDQTANYSATLGKGSPYQADITFGTCGGTYSCSAEAWIDFNGNQIFEPGESIGTWSGNPTANITFNFNVPLAAVDGPTRMRIIQQEGGSLPLDPCASFTWGSTTDFEVVIGQGMDCTGYVGDSIQDPRIVSSLPYQESYSNEVCYSNNVTVYNSPDVFYRLLPTEYGVTDINVSLCGSQFDTYLQILDPDKNVLYFNDDYCGGHSEITFSTIGYDTLYVVVQGYNNSKGDYTININDGAIVSTNEYRDLEVKVFPNPAVNGSTTVSWNSQIDGIEVLSSKGDIVYKELNPTNSYLELNSLAEGIYFVRLYNSNESIVKKIVVQS